MLFDRWEAKLFKSSKPNKSPNLYHLAGPKIGTEEWRATLVLINGLKDSPSRNWESPSGRRWYEKIVEEFPSVSVVSFSYTTQPFRTKSEMYTEEIARDFRLSLCKVDVFDKHVVFVAYSYGGLILQHLISDIASIELDSYFSIRMINLKAIIFLGTPNLGTNYTKLIIPLMSQAVNDIDKNPRMSVVLRDRFQRALAVIKGDTYCFCVGETLREKFVFNLVGKISIVLKGAVVVNVKSALGIPDSDGVAVTATHRELPFLEFEEAERVLDVIRSHLRPVKVDPIISILER